MDDREAVQMAAPTWTAYVEATAGTLGKVDAREIGALVDAIVDAYRDGQMVFLIGNGGSGASASHLCEDLGKGTLTDLRRQRRLRVVSLTDNVPYILAWANDEGYECVFVQQLKNLAEPGALLIAISGSGNSPNVLRAVEYANEHGVRTFGVCGYDGGALKRAAQQSLHVRCDDMGMVEAVHGVVFHYLVDALREAFAALAESQ